MGDRTGIQWTDATWNPVTGCTKVSQGCAHCYAERQFPRVYGDRKFTEVRCHPERLDQPLRWRRARKVFVNSMSDLFHPDVPLEFIDKVFAVMAIADWHTFQVLTKRPERTLEYWSDHLAREDAITDAAANFDARFTDVGGWYLNTDRPFPNVWLGVSVESPAYKHRIDELRRVYANVRFLSLEPLLEDLGQLDLNGIDWVIVGGESGPKARPMHPDWARSIRDQCREARVPFFFKQWGAWTPHSLDLICDSREERQLYDGTWLYRSRRGKKPAGRLLDGIEYNEYPEALS